MYKNINETIPLNIFFQTDLLTSNMLLCRREEYFSNPDSFIPERWLRDNKYEYTNSNPFVFQPFGFGPRSCIGKRLANLEIECFLAKVIFDISRSMW